MLSKTERKILGVKRYYLEGILFEIKKITPEDYLDKEGIPISKWQFEAENISRKQKEGTINFTELTKFYKSVFDKAIVSIDNKEDENIIKPYIEKILTNYFLCAKLYEIIGNHCFAIKKKSLFQKLLFFR